MFSMGMIAPPASGSAIPPLGVRGRLPWRKNWPSISLRAGEHGPISRKADPRFTKLTRQRCRRAAMEAAIAEIAKRFGGEPRRRRRAMGIALGKRTLRTGAGKAAQA